MDGDNDNKISNASVIALLGFLTPAILTMMFTLIFSGNFNFRVPKLIVMVRIITASSYWLLYKLGYFINNLF